MSFITRKALDLLLLMMFLASVMLALLAQEDPFARNWFCKSVVCVEFEHSKAWLKISYDVAIGSLVSLIFYGLVVRLPDYQKRRRVRHTLLSFYKRFKEDSIKIILGVVERSYDAGLPETLTAQDKFREYFKTPVSSSQDKWHVFLNNIDERRLQELLTVFEVFRDEVAFALASTDIRNEKPFDILKHLSATLRTLQDSKIGYDEIKPVSRFLWEVLAGWSWIDGYRKDDFIEKMIKEI